MMPIATILVATDFSPDGNNAVWRAALLARELDARLTLLHVIDTAGFKPWRDWFSRPLDIDLQAEQARTTLRQLAAAIVARHDVTATVDVRVGDPQTALLDASEQADLLVIGQRGRTAWKSVLVGSTADHMFHSSPVPLLVVKCQAHAAYQRVLVPVDLTAHSEAAVQMGAALARSADIEVFHAIESAGEAVLREADVTREILRNARARDEARVHARMRRSVARVGLDGRRVNFSLIHGHPVPASLRLLRAAGADLVVVAPGIASAGIRFLVGSVSHRLLTLSDCDTLIGPPVERARPVSPPSSFIPAARPSAVLRSGGFA